MRSSTALRSPGHLRFAQDDRLFMRFAQEQRPATRGGEVLPLHLSLRSGHLPATDLRMFAVFTPPDGPTWQRILFGAAAVIILLHAYRGWRSGAVRQIVSIVALVLAYAAAIFGRDMIVPLLRPIGLPDRYLSFIGGVLLATVIYGTVMVLSAIIFKKTAQQD